MTESQVDHHKFEDDGRGSCKVLVNNSGCSKPQEDPVHDTQQLPPPPPPKKKEL